MRLRRMLWLSFAVVCACAASSVAVASTPARGQNRILATPTMLLAFSTVDPTDPEELDMLRVGYPLTTTVNATNSYIGSCASRDAEYFGNSVATPEGGNILVGPGSTGSWTQLSARTAIITSTSQGCPGSAGVPITTAYKISGGTRVAPRIDMLRAFAFAAHPLAANFRPYMPRLHPRAAFSQVIHPDASGQNLVTEYAANCPLGCQVANWNGSWFAINDPGGPAGMVVVHDSSTMAGATVPVNLWVDNDDNSDTNVSGVLLLQPAGGFTAQVVEKEHYCFYREHAPWTPNLVALPPGC